jgi:hypothetical protein
LFSRDTDSRWHWRTDYLLGGAENTGG